MIALSLTLTITFTLVALPTANAHTPPWTIISYAYLVPAPNPVGVGQRVLIVMWVDTPMPSATVDNDIRRHDYKLTITKPDGTTETMNWPYISDPTGVQYVSWTPDQVGTYTLKFDYPQQTYTWNATSAMRTYTNDTFSAASKTTTLTVQQEPLPKATTSYPLPTEYWTRPIEGQNTDWWSISSNWLGEPYIQSGLAQGGGTLGNYFGRVQPDGIAPNSPHVMWSRPIQDGGVVGGSSYDVLGKTYYMGGSYNTRFSNALIMHGRLYYELPWGNSGGGGGWMCVDLRTGEEIWHSDQMGVSGTGIPSPSFGYLYSFDDPNQHGVVPSNGWLFSSNFARAYDPGTGRIASLNVTNVPSGTAVAGTQGEILRYSVSNIGNSTNPNWRLTQWNSSQVFTTQDSGTINASTPNRYDWNISITLGRGSWSIDRASLDNIMLLVQGSFGAHVGAAGATVSSDGANVTAISLKPASRGQVLWTKYYPAAPGNVTRAISNWDPELGVFVLHDKETMVHYGYSLKDGSLLWGPTESTNDYTYFRNQPTAAYGKLYWAGYGGTLYCYDMKNGTLLWTYGNGGPGNSTFAGLETSWGTYPVFVDVIADGKVYLASTEHSPGSPFYKDTRYRCIDAYTGKEIWTLMGWGTGMDATYDRVADGFFVYLNCYDMQIYCVGKGPSATTVTASPKVSVNGDSVLIEGTVIDTAAGTKQNEPAARFPNGVPAVSDASMSAWMEYVYMQKPRPANATGVEVTLDTIDPNGNWIHIGNATSDTSGTFSYMWTPDVPGKYTVIATFAGSESYWPSYAETAIGVDAAPPAPPAPEPAAPLPPYEMYTIGAAIAIIIAVAIVGLMILRKRP
jgi:outer membrane protein assembly factor BamB